MVHDQNNFSKSYNQMYLEETRVLKANKALAVIHDFLGPTSEMYLLDIGCSTGIMTNQYAKKFKNTVGIDIDTSGIKFAKESFENKNLNFYNCSHEDIMLGNEKFDVVICTHIYEHVNNPNDYLKTCQKLLKPNGLMVCSTINRTSKSFLFAILGAEYILRWLPKGTHNWEKFIKPDELSNLISEAGLELVDKKGFILNPIAWEWQTSDRDLAVNYVTTSIKNNKF